MDMQPMMARRLLRLAVVGELKAKLDASVTVLSPGNWPTPQEKLPAVLVKVPTEQKQSLNKGMPEFTTTITLQVEGRLEGATPEDAQDAIEDLGYQVEEAILKGYWIGRVVQQFASVSTDVEINSESKTHIAGFRMVFACETFEGFDPTVTAPDGTTWPPADPVIVALQGVDVHEDAASPFDASGTYTGSDFPQAVTPAPRTTGPDGRDEGALQIDLPQT